MSNRRAHGRDAARHQGALDKAAVPVPQLTSHCRAAEAAMSNLRSSFRAVSGLFDGVGGTNHGYVFSEITLATRGRHAHSLNARSDA